MKTKILIAIALGFVVGAAVIVMFRDDEATAPASSQEVNTGQEAEAGATKVACDVFTAEIAQEVLGEDAKKGELPAAATGSTDDVSVSNCLYEADDPSSRGIITANILVRGGKTESGKSSNQFGFENNKTAEGRESPIEDINGLGDGAYYDKDLNQVNVLLSGGTYWVIISADDPADKKDKAASEKLARAVVENF